MVTTNTNFLDIISNGGEQADKVMLNMLHQHLNHQLRQRFEVYHNQLFGDFEDVVDDFFFYLRNGKEENDQQTYPSLRSIEKKESLEPWILNTFRNYLSVRAAKERKLCYSELSTENIADEDTLSSILTDEEMLSIASHLIAYAHQILPPRDRFIFLRTMLSILNKKKAIPNKAMAKALGMTYVAYREAAYRTRCHLADYCSRLLQDESLRLDDKHLQMAQQINDDFQHLYPTLLGYYSQAIDALPCADNIKQLRQNHYLDNGNIMHESLPSYSTTITIAAFWNHLNRLLIV